MTSFDEHGQYIKTNWKTGDKITAIKLNKIEESIEAVNSRMQFLEEEIERLEAIIQELEDK